MRRLPASWPGLLFARQDHHRTHLTAHWHWPGDVRRPLAGATLHLRQRRHAVVACLDDPGELEGARPALRELGAELVVEREPGPMEGWGGQSERLFVVRTDAFEPQPDRTAAELASEGIGGLRWSELTDLEGGRFLFAPRRLPDLLRDLLEHGPPRAPLDVGV